jgi:hypothetical protein
VGGAEFDEQDVADDEPDARDHGPGERFIEEYAGGQGGDCGS